MRINYKQSSLPVFAGICITGILFLTACSSGSTPEATDEIEVAAAATVEQTSSQAPTEEATETSSPAAVETGEVYPAPIDVQDGAETTPQGGYPAPGYQFPTEDPGSGGYPYPSPEQGNPPPVKTELQATNPATVNLATGGPQLIEFFAFW